MDIWWHSFNLSLVWSLMTLSFHGAKGEHHNNIRVGIIRTLKGTLRGTLRVRSYYLLLEVGGLYMFIIVILGGGHPSQDHFGAFQVLNLKAHIGSWWVYLSKGHRIVCNYHDPLSELGMTRFSFLPLYCKQIQIMLK